MWKPEERLIFSYWDGATEKKADPLVIYRTLLNQEGVDFKADSALVDTGDLQALGRIIEATRKAFGVAEFGQDASGNPIGLLDSEVLQLLAHFGQWITELEKKVTLNATLPSPTDATFSSSPTSSPSDSGSVGSGP